MSCWILFSGFTLSSSLLTPSLQSTETYRVNAPYFAGDIRLSETAIFWFGRVTPTENAVDVRVGYNDDYLFVHVAVIDRRAWYDTSPTPETLTQWDSTTVYIDTGSARGAVPTETSHRFDAQLVWWEDRADYQAAYVGDGVGWTLTNVLFKTFSDWSSMESTPNDDDKNDRGWFIQYWIPFESLGLDGCPTEGTEWALSVVMHDRDSADVSSQTDQSWPATASAGQPATWGELTFGMPTYEPPPAIPEATVTFREGLNGVVVPDAPVGGGTLCGGNADYWTEWGDLNYGDAIVANVQNQGNIDDWPCFSRYYLTFPLDALPSDRKVISATLTLHHRGNTGIGWDPGPQPSLVQVLVVNEEWNEATLTWNNAPEPIENIAATWVEPVEEDPGLPGIPYDWDVSRAVADAYEAGTPVHLAVYEADEKMQSGKYFRTSEEDDFNAVGRPTLQVTYGIPAPSVTMQASASIGYQNDVIDYTLSFLGTGNTLTMTNTLPSGVSDPMAVTIDGSNVDPTYDAGLLTWQGTPALDEQITIQYAVTITTEARKPLLNQATLGSGMGLTSEASVMVLANPYLLNLPIVLNYRP